MICPEEKKTIKVDSFGHRGISVRHLNLRINGNHILKDISVDFPDRKITCIIGHSGCGKSTLLKTLNRLNDNIAGVEIDGHVYVDGEDLFGKDVEVTHIRKKIGLIAQRPTPLPMSIFDNVAYGCRIHGIRKKNELKEIVETNLRLVGMWDEVKDRLKESASSLSIGQQQRLCLARGLAVQPEFILGDESTSALDPISSRLVEDLFVELKKKYGIILVTHTLRQALKMADFVIFVYMGKIIEMGSAKDLLEHPKEELTKQYLSGIFS
ncbi:ABC-type phosphate transporter ATP-binding component [Candidatus Azobacteroides pseudotrichonymphae genomovar. CFP2]|uniref:ABC-type phosphate transporter ATP-binding component n=2 Tax=Candidatus Azobacteroides TaxID=511434 RepID=B6YQR3_AZOPC|nr:ABC-type phosphate transporter ATP-binding component [Candidatus Azobacteroides pseudotrichonymphae genomovar. CFP2]